MFCCSNLKTRKEKLNEKRVRYTLISIFLPPIYVAVAIYLFDFRFGDTPCIIGDCTMYSLQIEGYDRNYVRCITEKIDCSTPSGYDPLIGFTPGHLLPSVSPHCYLGTRILPKEEFDNLNIHSKSECALSKKQVGNGFYTTGVDLGMETLHPFRNCMISALFSLPGLLLCMADFFLPMPDEHLECKCRDTTITCTIVVPFIERDSAK